MNSITSRKFPSIEIFVLKGTKLSFPQTIRVGRVEERVEIKLLESMYCVLSNGRAGIMAVRTGDTGRELRSILVTLKFSSNPISGT